MKLVKIALFLILPILASNVLAGAGHDHGVPSAPVSQDEVRQRATQQVAAIIDAGKLDASWREAPVVTLEKKQYSQGPEWVVVLKNDKITDETKKTLYLFFSMDGHYLAANYTGE